MTYRPRRSCRRCGRDRDACGGVSHTGLCRDCGPLVSAEALAQIAAKDGPHYDAWLDGMTEAIARLWGARVLPEQLADLAELDQSQEVTAWPAGS